MLALALLLAMQDRVVLPAPDDDGTHTVSSAPCGARADEIIVCGDGDMSRFRAGPLDDTRWTERPLRPRLNLPRGARAVMHAEQRSLPGASAPAAMVTVKIPLGRKPRKK